MTPAPIGRSAPIIRKKTARPEHTIMPKAKLVGLSEKQIKAGPKREGLGPQPVVNPCHTIYAANAEREKQNARPSAPLVVLMPSAHSPTACARLFILTVIAINPGEA